MGLLLEKEKPAEWAGFLVEVPGIEPGSTTWLACVDVHAFPLPYREVAHLAQSRAPKDCGFLRTLFLAAHMARRHMHDQPLRGF
jgi:hypothetical protein